MNGLQTLLGLKSVSNMTPTARKSPTQAPANTTTLWEDSPEVGQNWLAQRQADIHSGMDNLMPDADSPVFREYQNELGGSRAGHRDAAMSELRRILTLKDIEHQQKLEQTGLAGAYDIEAQRAGQASAMDRLLATQSAISGRADSNADLRRELEGIRGDVTADRDDRLAADRMELERYRRGEMAKLQEARQPSGWASLFKLLGGGMDEPAQEPTVAEPMQPEQLPRRRGRIISVE